jgi:hypothetical protein
MSAQLLPTWDELAVSRPVLAATMLRYLQQGGLLTAAPQRRWR